MSHPLQAIQSNRRKSVFLILLVVTITFLLLMNWIGAPLISSEAPFGIVSYEFAVSPEKSMDILNSWDQSAELRAAFSLGLDFLFLVLYSTTIALACIWAGDVLLKNCWPFARIAVPLAWGMWFAALLDAIENVALVYILFEIPHIPWPELAAFCALIKFVFVFSGMIYAFLGLTAHTTRAIVKNKQFG